MMNKVLKILLALWLLPAAASAQQLAEQFHREKEYRPFFPESRQQNVIAEKNHETVYQIPFASQGNVIQLTIANTTSSVISDLQIKVQQTPPWLRVFPQSYAVQKLQTGAGETVRFTFRLAKNAPVGASVELTFKIVDAKGYQWKKSIALQVAAPAKFMVSPNYPNPFTQFTKMRVILPAPMQVKISVFDILGRRVTILSDQQHPAGSYTYRWDPDEIASGVYFCRIIAEAENNSKKKMEVVKMMYIK